MLEHFAIDQENVFNAFSQSHDFSSMQVDLVAGKDQCNGIQQSGTVIGRDRQDEILSACVRSQIQRRGNRERAGFPGKPGLQGRRERCCRSQQFHQFMFNQRDDVAIVFFKSLFRYQKSIECVIVVCRVDFRIQNAEILSCEIAADQREQIGAVKRVNRNLQAFPDRRETALDDGFCRVATVI